MTARYKLTKAQTIARRKIRKGCTLTLAMGRGTGKSWFMRNLAYEMIDQGRVSIALVSPTLKQCKLNHGDLMREELGEDWKHLGGKEDKHSSTWRFRNGSIIQFYGCVPRPSRGPRFDVVMLDEADDIDKGLFHSVIFPWLSATWSKQIVILGGTPTRGRFGLLYEQYSRGYDERFPDNYTVMSTAYDSPEITSPDAVRKAFESSPRPLFMREWLCNFDSGNGLVYPMFSRRHHIRKMPSELRSHRTIIGGDHGYRDPTVFIPLSQVGYGGDMTLYVEREYYATNVLPSKNLREAKKLDALCSPASWYYDPSVPGVISEMRDLGINVQPAKNAILEGVSYVADFLAVRPTEDGGQYSHLYFDPSCENLLRELETYKRKEDPRNPGNFLEELVDRDNHAMDALRYGIFSEFGSGSTHRETR